jgi:hypothetical protein
MANPIQPPRPLLTQLHLAWSARTSKATGRRSITSLLFSINDTITIAWYYFDEELSGGSGFTPTSNDGWGWSRSAQQLPTTKPRKVNEFAIMPINRKFVMTPDVFVAAPRARLRVERVDRDNLKVGMTVFLADGPENFSWLLSTTDGVKMPQEFLWGNVSIRATEPYGAGILQGAKRFLPKMGRVL